jgi:hypothetical protein
MFYYVRLGWQNRPNPTEVRRVINLINGRGWELLLALVAAALNFGAKLIDYLRDKRNSRRKR